MSVDALRWAMRLSGISCTQKAVLIHLSDFANEQGISYPRHETLASRACLSREATTRLLGQLKDLGLITPVDPPATARKRVGNTGRFALKAYQCHLGRTRVIEQAPASAPCDGESQGEAAVGDEAAPPCDRESQGPRDGGSQGPCDPESQGDEPPCDPGSLDHVIEDHRHHVIVDHRPIRNGTSEDSELQDPGKEKESSRSLDPDPGEQAGRQEANRPPAPTWLPKLQPSKDTLDELRSGVCRRLNLPLRAWLEPTIRYWEIVYRHASAENAEIDEIVAEAAKVAEYAITQAQKAGHRTISMRSYAERYLDYRAGAYTPEPDQPVPSAGGRAIVDAEARRRRILGHA